MDARAVDYFSAEIPNVHAGYLKIGETLLKINGNYRPFSD